MNNFLREVCNQEQLKNILIETTNDGILIIQNNQCRYINHSFIKTTGYSIEDLNKTLLSRIYPDKHYRAVLEKYRSGEEIYSSPSSFEISLKARNGTIRYLSISSYAVFHDKGPAVIAIIKDITEHREAEKERDQVLERFKTITGSMEHYVYFLEYLNDEPILMFHNPLSYDITGFTPADFLKDPDLIKRIIYKEDRQKVDYYMDKSRRDESSEIFSHRIVHASGSTRTVRHRFSTSRNKKTRYETGFMLGITEKPEYPRNPSIIIEDKKTDFLIPLCSECKRIKDEQGNWTENDLHSDALSSIKFTHSLCPECVKKLYGDKKWFKN